MTGVTSNNVIFKDVRSESAQFIVALLATARGKHFALPPIILLSSKFRHYNNKKPSSNSWGGRISAKMPFPMGVVSRDLDFEGLPMRIWS